MDAYAQLIGEAGRLLGIETLEPDADGVVEIVSEDAAIIVMRTGEPEDVVFMTAKVMDAADAAPDAFRRALEFNFQPIAGGATVSRDPDDGSFVLSDYAPLRVMTPEGFVSKLESFASALAKLRGLLADDGTAEEQSVPPDSADMSGFMLV
jgi:hypothetical protein